MKYEPDLNTILDGLNAYKKSIPTKRNKVNLYYNSNIKVNLDNLDISFSFKEQLKPFKSYIDYYNRLLSCSKRIKSNSQSKLRKTNYEFKTTISRGYDAPAASVIAKILSANTALTFNKPQKYEKDDGSEIALTLGYENVITKNADLYLKNNSYEEAKYLASGELGSGIVFEAFKAEFANSIITTGERGDKIWERNYGDVNNDMRFKNEIFPGTSFTEHRLFYNYIIFPIPLYGANQWISINKISKSDEMKAYAIREKYDRPIPRKLLEDSGVDRNNFGRDKIGAGINYRFDNKKRIKSRISDSSFKYLQKFSKANRRSFLTQMKLWIAFGWKVKYYYLDYFLNRLGVKVKFNKQDVKKYQNPGLASYMFLWGVSEMMKEYSKSNIRS